MKRSFCAVGVDLAAAEALDDVAECRGLITQKLRHDYSVRAIGAGDKNSAYNEHCCPNHCEGVG